MKELKKTANKNNAWMWTGIVVENVELLAKEYGIWGKIENDTLKTQLGFLGLFAGMNGDKELVDICNFIISLL